MSSYSSIGPTTSMHLLLINHTVQTTGPLVLQSCVYIQLVMNICLWPTGPTELCIYTYSKQYVCLYTICILLGCVPIVVSQVMDLEWLLDFLKGMVKPVLALVVLLIATLIILEEARFEGGNGLFDFQVISSALCHLIRSSVHN